MPNFYSFLKESEGSELVRYSFNTQHGYTYFASFYHFEGYANLPVEFPQISKYAYMFSFGLDSNSEEIKKRKSDDRIEPTIIKIINDFFYSSNKEMVIVFHTDMLDNKHAARLRLFEKWYKCNFSNSLIYFDTIEVKLPDSTQYLGMFIFRTHKEFNEVTNEFKTQTIALLREK